MRVFKREERQGPKSRALYRKPICDDRGAAQHVVTAGGDNAAAGALSICFSGQFSES